MFCQKWNDFWAWFNGGLDNVKAGIRVVTNALEAPLQFLVNYSAIIILLTFVALILVCVLIKKDSLSAMRHIRTLVICGLFMALNIVLGYFTIGKGTYLEIGLGSITLPVIATLYGPLTACVVGLLQDIVKFLLDPSGAYIPTLTILAGMGGLTYGIFFYGKKITLCRVFAAKLTVNVVLNMILYSIALAPAMGIGIAAMLPARIIKNLITWPILSLIIYALVRAVQRVIPKQMYK